jgi:hypothetical protein
VQGGACSDFTRASFTTRCSRSYSSLDEVPILLCRSVTDAAKRVVASSYSDTSRSFSSQVIRVQLSSNRQRGKRIGDSVPDSGSWPKLKKLTRRAFLFTARNHSNGTVLPRSVPSSRERVLLCINHNFCTEIKPLIRLGLFCAEYRCVMRAWLPGMASSITCDNVQDSIGSAPGLSLVR